jgi:hypothetical protein
MYDKAVWDKVVELIADGKTMVEVEQMPGMPVSSAVRYHARQDVEYSKALDDAYKIHVERHVERIKEIEREMLAKIADEPFDSRKVNAIQNAYKQIIEDIKWYAGKISRNKFGDKTMISGDPDAPLLNTKEITVTCVMGPPAIQPTEK